MGTRANPAALRRAAEASDRLAAALKREVDLLEPDTASAVQALPGFRTRQVLERFQWGWTDALGRHETYLAQIGTSLTTCAIGYRQSDDASAQSFRALDRF